MASHRLFLQPITQKEARAFIEEHHRHHRAPAGWKFGIAVSDGTRVVGVVCVGRPVARALDDGWTAEVLRLCTDGTQNACSMLYGAAARASRAMGYRRVITYTLQSEGGGSLRAAGWRLVGSRADRTWAESSVARPRVPTDRTGQKYLWECAR